MPNKVDAVFEIVKQGPVLPIEVATKLNLDSFTAKALLDYLFDNKKVKITEQKVGDASIYFVPGHELAAEAKLKALLNIKPKVGNFATEPIAQTPDLEKKRAEFLQRLKEIEEREKKVQERSQEQSQVKTFEAVQLAPKAEIEPEKENIDSTPIKSEELSAQGDLQSEIILREEKIETAKIKEIKETKEKESNLIEEAIAWLNAIHANVLQKELRKKGKEALLKVLIESPLGNLPLLVFVLNKKSISEAELSLVYAESVRKACPALILAKGKLTKSASSYLKEIEGFIKFKQLN